MKFALLASTFLAAAPCQAVTCQDAWNYAYCAYPPLRVASFPGATLGDQIVNCVNALPVDGGVCDARDSPTGSVIPSITLSKSKAIILGPCGAFSVTGTINVYNPAGITNFQWDMCNARLVWNGNATDPLLRIRGARDSEFSHFSIASNQFIPLATAIQLETATGTVSTHRTLRDISINGTAAGGLNKGVRWCIGDDCGGAGPDNNNDLDIIDSVIVQNCTTAAFSLEGTQVQGIEFRGSQFNGNAVCARGVTTTQAVNPNRNSGSFSWYGGGGGSTTVADFDLGAPNNPVLISGFVSEESTHFMSVGVNPGGSAWPITVMGGRWSAARLAADNNVIVYRYRGPLNLIGLGIDGAQAGSAPQFNMAGDGGPASATAIGVRVNNQAATALTNPFAGNTWSLMGNIVNDDSGNVFRVPNK